MPNFSRSKDNQAIKFRQLIEYSKRNIFLQKSCRKWGRETSLRPHFTFCKKKKTFLIKKASTELKASCLKVSFNIFRWSSTCHTIKTNYKTLDYSSRDMLNFEFLVKSLGIVSPPHFVKDFSRKIFLMLYSVNWPNFIAWMLLPLEILGDMCIVITC